MRPVLLLSTPDSVSNHSQADFSYSMARTSYPCADPYFGGLFNPYGPHAFIQPQMGSHMVGMTAGRVPLPLDLADDGPIYVNAKQYHGILRRRQSRAKLEAQNKLVKNRKPYLHESRHIHALNRVRGSGGRFLSTKKRSNPTSSPSQCNVSDTVRLHPKNGASELESCQSRTGQSGVSNTTCSDITSVSNSDVNFRLPDHRFSGIAAHLGGGVQINGGLMSNGHHASVVR
ncbi:TRANSCRIPTION FACTOR NF-Y ALPHA-RELATED [Salix viminalis]|uniref:Nuclear transcription factor Y subunit n=1 Tax=Salix viminalis TaxID=40686 RepID=A0A9Q0V689_SALVM|nr:TRANSCRIPTION FACTOR NF-Y ALPHA-RELATED [Salix viminalis]